MAELPNSESDAARRRKLRFRCWHRGTRETDLLMGEFADTNIERMGEAELDELDRLLECADSDLYNWITAKLPVPAEMDGPVLRRLRSDVAQRGPGGMPK